MSPLQSMCFLLCEVHWRKFCFMWDKLVNSLKTNVSFCLRRLRGRKLPVGYRRVRGAPLWERWQMFPAFRHPELRDGAWVQSDWFQLWGRSGFHLQVSARIHWWVSGFTHVLHQENNKTTEIFSVCPFFAYRTQLLSGNKRVWILPLPEWRTLPRLDQLVPMRVSWWIYRWESFCALMTIFHEIKKENAK